MRDLARYFDKLKDKHASELVLTADRAPSYRSDRSLLVLPGEAPLSDATLRTLLEDLVGIEQWIVFQGSGVLRFSVMRTDGTRIAGTCAETSRGVSVTLRLWPDAPASCRELGIPSAAISCSETSSGLVVVAAPMRSGKTTTLAALAAHAAETRARHVITIDDPLELVPDACAGIVSSRQVGTHCMSFAAGIQAALRSDADLISISELDAPGALEAALEAAAGGALVMGGVRASSRARALETLLASVHETRRAEVRSELEGALRCVLVQRVLPTRSGGQVGVFEVSLGNANAQVSLRDAFTALVAQGKVDAADEKRLA